jgi:N-acetylmuramoyl-L-alanine amidase
MKSARPKSLNHRTISMAQWFNDLGLALFLMLLTFGASAMTIIVDPGHGGIDDGATGRLRAQDGVIETIAEKDVTLALARAVATELKKSGHTVYLTRAVDRTVSLDERAELSERIKADLFLSIHLNSSPDPTHSGMEIFYLDNHSDVAVKKLESVENRNVDGGDQIVGAILADLVVQRVAPESKRLATLLEKHYIKTCLPDGPKNRGIKPALFYVLALSKRPSVLIEAGFVTNRSDVERLLSRSFQEKFARSIIFALGNFPKKREVAGVPLL